ncbi:MAG: hypothetical protein FWC89_07955 [Defluviitaleaceae bacterium]|nr:hypothetical protein [Defluviitaleaceae bacterium]
MQRKKVVLLVSVFTIITILVLSTVVFLYANSRETIVNTDWKLESFSPIDANGFFFIGNNGSLQSWMHTDAYGMPFTIMENVYQFVDGRRFLVITEDGVLWEVDDGNYVFERFKIIDDVIKVSAPRRWIRTSGAITSDGSLWVWGIRYSLFYADSDEIERAFTINPKLFDYDYLGVILFLEDVRYVSMQNELAIKNDDSLWTWSFNMYGQIGDGTTSYRIIPVKVMDDVQAAVGRSHKLAIKNDGSLWAWGRNHRGQLGDGTTIDRHEPVKVMDNVRQVVVGRWHTMAVTEDNTLWAWGANFGSLGDGTEEDRHSPVKIMDNVLYVVSTDDSDDFPASMAIRTDGSLWAWGRNGAGEVGDGTRVDRLRPVRIMDNVVYASVGSFANAAVQSDGSLWVWGGMYCMHLNIVTGSIDRVVRPERVAENVRLSTFTEISVQED